MSRAPSPKPGGSDVQTTGELADRLGLSRWTVSRVLNGHPGVRPETVARVRAAMQELGFTPDPLARGLRGGRTGMVGVCFQELDSPILAMKVSTLQDELRGIGYRAMIELTGGRADLEDGVVRHFLAARVEGIVLLGSALRAEDPAVEVLARSGIPVVAIDPLHALPFPGVALDRRQAMELVVRHLHEAGHRRIALLGVDPEDRYAAVRLAGLRREAKRLGIALPDDVPSFLEPHQPTHDYAYGTRLGEAFLAAADPATAAIAINDRVAIGFMHALRLAGRKVPADLSVVGYDNLAVGEYLDAPLTTIDQQVGELMRAAAGLLLEGLDRREDEPPAAPGAPRLVAPRLVVRATVAPQAGLR